MLAEISVEETDRTLDRVVDDLLWESSVDRPPIDTFVIARELRLRVVCDRTINERGRFVRLGDGSRGAVVLGPEERPERRHWALAHEIGEAFAYRVFEVLGVDPIESGQQARESVANALAGRLLAPKCWLAGVYRETGRDLFATKAVFATASYELLARRLLEALNEPLVVSVFDHDRLSWRRQSLLGRTPPLSRTERLAQRRAHRRAEPVFVENNCRVHCWPIHEPGWKREILFCEPLTIETDPWHGPNEWSGPSSSGYLRAG